MRDLINAVFIVLLVGGIVLLIYASKKRNDLPNQRRWQGAGFSIWGLGLLTFGFASFYLITHSPQAEVVGAIQRLHQHVGKSDSCNFRVVPDSGQSVSIHARFNGNGLANGDTVRVSYVAFDQKLLSMTILSGDHMSAHLEESDDSKSSLFIGFFGVFVEILGLLTLIKGLRHHVPLSR